MNMGSADGFVYQKLNSIGGSFWVSVSALFLTVFGLINRFFFRIHKNDDESRQRINSNCSTVPFPLQEAEFEQPISVGTEDTDEEETSSLFFKFKFQTCEEFSKSDEEISAYTSKYELNPEKIVRGVIEDKQDVSLYGSFSNQETTGTGDEILLEKDFMPQGNSRESSCKEDKTFIVIEEEKKPPNGGSGDVQFLSEMDLLALDSVTSSNVEFSSMSQISSDAFLSDRDFELVSVKNSSIQDSEMLFHEKQDSKNQHLGGTGRETSSLQDCQDSNGLETLWEHQDLIEQLKMELKKVKAIGLPTILEESESPKIMEDLKPWKIDEKFHHEDELHKFYKSYRERMRKFDIFSYQKMYTIGFLQSKDPVEAISSLKPSSPGMASLLSKRKKSECDPMKKFMRELHSDLEVVYVGQLCLSWEILHWQYDKSLELWESDRYGIHRYNEVAGEFQQFQVLMQRFIENEPFDGPRVQNYVKNRCVLRNLLQVPLIREDSVKKGRMKGKDEYAITTDMLVEILEESIRIFWRFIRADTSMAIQKGRKGTQIQPQDALDLEVLATCLQKKEKKLKDIVRSGKCLLRKLQKNEESSDQVLYFFSQVDMKLVARVLNMEKITTDQLLWCRNKLSNINFVSRKKIHVQPSFFLFPC